MLLYGKRKKKKSSTTLINLIIITKNPTTIQDLAKVKAVDLL